jgi:hypothetical protein
MSVPVLAAFVFDSVSIAYASMAGLMEAGSSRGGTASGRSEIGAGAGNLAGSTICLFLRVRILRAVGIGGGCTGARGRGGRSVRGTIGGGGFDVAGCPSASRNRRMRSSSDPTGARLIGSLICGVVRDL